MGTARCALLIATCGAHDLSILNVHIVLLGSPSEILTGEKIVNAVLRLAADI
jgi:hypothetical protein